MQRSKIKDQRSNKSIIFLGITVLFLLFALCALRLSEAMAQEMKSENFVINGGNFNMTSGNKESARFKLSDVVGQTAAVTFTTKGYIIQSGFLNAAAADTFLFTVTPNLIDFGSIYPNNPIERKVKLFISNGNSPGYTVKAAENQPLSTSVGAVIPDTSCDAADNALCTQTAANRWSEAGSYGFGYNLSGLTIPSDFKADNYYRPFAATIRNEKPILVMQSKNKKAADQAVMTLRLNISRQQPVGLYRNILNFTAMPGI